MSGALSVSGLANVPRVFVAMGEAWNVESSACHHLRRPPIESYCVEKTSEDFSAVKRKEIVPIFADSVKYANLCIKDIFDTIIAPLKQRRV